MIRKMQTQRKKVFLRVFGRLFYRDRRAGESKNTLPRRLNSRVFGLKSFTRARRLCGGYRLPNRCTQK